MRFTRSLPLLLGALPISASAHEVYVLPADVAKRAITDTRFNEWPVVAANMHAFVFWGFVAIVVITAVFFASISRVLERSLNPLLRKLPPYAPAISRITIALAFLAAAYYGALSGPELPIADTFGPCATIVTAGIVAIGLMLLTGYYVRLAAVIGLAIFAVEIAAHGVYMLTYANYIGELLLLLILGSHMVGIHDKRTDLRHAPRAVRRLKERLSPYALPILRVSFGVSLLYASLYAKIIHNDLALSVATQYPDVVRFFGFEPHFLVLGAGIIEILLALFFILGIEIRFACLFLLFWLSLSLVYFGEAVWPHLMLLGIPIAFLFYGYDDYSLEGRFFKKGARPVL